MADFLIDLVSSTATQISHQGRHRLAGVVTVDGQPASRLVCVFDRMTMVLLAAKFSDQNTGAWEFTGLPEYAEGGLFTTVSSHPATENAAVFDSISQVTS